MAIPTLTNIKNAIGEGVRTNLFRVSFAGGLSGGTNSQISFMCKAAAIPASNVSMIEIPHVAGRKLKIAGDRTYDEWTTTIINDANYNVRTALEEYQNQFVFNNFDNTAVGNRGSNALLTTVTVEQLNGNGAAIRTYRLQNSFISEISAIDLSYDNTDSLEEFTVNWVFDYYTIS
jgi:hypothetical protein